MQVQAPTSVSKPRLLFVDDEQRVLNSMRVMFRRNFDLYLASHGAEALDIVKENDIDVIVADHRMPQMTGVEVLSAVRTLSPRTVRILLTGYADLDAVEGSINDSEVFRFLTKPCAPDQLRSTVELAASVARQTPYEIEASSTASDLIDIGEPLAEDIALVGDTAGPEAAAATAAHAAATQQAEAELAERRHEKTAVLNEVPAPTVDTAAKSALPGKGNGFGVIVFTDDNDVLESVQSAARGRVPIYHARTIVKVVKYLAEHRPGVLITDISDDKATIQAITAQLKEHLPELVTIAISQHRDVLDMVWLINHGQIFRFLRKPLSAGRCAVSLQSALQHHRELLKNPGLLKRHEVEEVESGSLLEGVKEKLRSVRELWATS
jgi:DNA-binding NtrC family response regulator